MEPALPKLERQVKVKAKKRSKSHAIRKALLKNKNIMDFKKEKLLLRLEADKKERQKQRENPDGNLEERTALDRFQSSKKKYWVSLQQLQ